MDRWREEAVWTDGERRMAVERGGDEAGSREGRGGTIGVVPLPAAAAAGRGTTPLGKLIIQKLTITSLHVHYHPLSAQVGHHLQITMHVHHRH